jgi:hypothetical protein
VTVWYMAMLPVDEAVARLEVSIQRNRRRFRRRTDSAHQAASDTTSLWPRILQHVLIAASARDPLPLANRLMRDGGTVLASRVA